MLLKSVSWDQSVAAYFILQLLLVIFQFFIATVGVYCVAIL